MRPLTKFNHALKFNMYYTLIQVPEHRKCYGDYTHKSKKKKTGIFFILIATKVNQEHSEKLF